jgi:hypothetical protein
VGAWAVLAAGLAVHGYWYPRTHTVFDIYAPASRMWWSGQDLYAPVVRAWLEDGRPASTVEHYRYCPLFAVAVTPFAVLPEAWGNSLWKTFNVAFLAAGLATACRRLFPLRHPGPQTAAVFLLAVPTSLHSMYNGQANCLMAGAVLFGLAAAADGRWNRSAAWLAAATLLKGYPLALGLLLSVLYPRRFPLRYAAALGVGLLLPFVTQRPGYVVEQTAGWWGHLRDSTELMRERLRSVDNLLAVCGRPITAQTFAWLELTAGVATLGLCLYVARRVTDARQRLTLVLFLYSAWVALFGPATETCTYVVMSPVVAWAVVEAFDRPAGWVVRLGLIASLLLMGPLITDMFGPAVRTLATKYGSQPAGALVFLAYVLTEAARCGRRAPPPVLAADQPARAA